MASNPVSLETRDRLLTIRSQYHANLESAVEQSQRENLLLLHVRQAVLVLVDSEDINAPRVAASVTKFLQGPPKISLTAIQSQADTLVRNHSRTIGHKVNDWSA